MSPPTLELRAASRRWGEVRALERTDLTIEPGERVAVIGPSGSGKSTLLRLLVFATRPSEGQVIAGDLDLTRASRRSIRDHRRRCSYVDQRGGLIDPLTVHENVVVGLVPRWPWHRVIVSRLWPLERERVADVLSRLEIGERQWARVTELSGGQRQRVAIARAMVAASPLLVLDEPTSALDPETAKMVLTELKRLADERGATTIMATHRVSEAKAFATRVIGLAAGEVRFDSKTSELSDDDIESIYRGSNERR